MNYPTTINLSTVLLQKIKDHFSARPSPSLYWDYQDEVSDFQIIQAIRNDPYHPLDHLMIHFTIDNDQYIYETELEFIRDNLEVFKEELAREMDLPVDDLDLSEIAAEMHDKLCCSFGVDFNTDQLLAGTVNVRVEMYSNYDCINSHWLESGGAYSMDSYFGDMVRMLKLNPPDVRRMLLDHGLKIEGRWKPRRDKGRRALVGIEDFWQELENTSCGACLLTFIGKVDKKELLANGIKGKITIPKGNKSGIYSSCQGGGSVIEMRLLRDFTIDLSKKYDEAGMLEFALHIDSDSSRGYSIKDVHGVTDGYFGQPVKYI